MEARENTEQILKAAAEKAAELKEPQAFFDAASIIIRQGGKDSLSRVAGAYDALSKELERVGVDQVSGFEVPVLVSGEQKKLAFFQSEAGIETSLTDKTGKEESRLGTYKEGVYHKISNIDFIPGSLTKEQFADDFRRICEDLQKNTKEDEILLNSEFGRTEDPEIDNGSENPVMMTVKAVRRHPIAEYKEQVEAFVNETKQALLGTDTQKGSHGRFGSKESMERFMEEMNGTKAQILDKMQTDLGDSLSFDVTLNDGTKIAGLKSYGKSLDEQLAERMTLVAPQMREEIGSKLEAEMKSMADRIFAAEAILSADQGRRDAEKNNTRDTRLYDLFNTTHPELAAKYNEFDIEVYGNMQPTIGLDENGATMDIPGGKTEVYAANINLTNKKEIEQALSDMDRSGLIEICQRESGSLATEKSVDLDAGTKLRVAMPEEQKKTLKMMAAAIAEGAKGIADMFRDTAIKVLENIADYNNVNRSIREANLIIGRVSGNDIEDVKKIQEKVLAPLIRNTRINKTAVLLEMDTYSADGKYGTVYGKHETAYLKVDSGKITIQWAGRELETKPDQAANAFAEYYRLHKYDILSKNLNQKSVATQGLNSYENKMTGITGKTGGLLGSIGDKLMQARAKAEAGKSHSGKDLKNRTPGGDGSRE